MRKTITEMRALIMNYCHISKFYCPNCEFHTHCDEIGPDTGPALWDDNQIEEFYRRCFAETTEITPNEYQKLAMRTANETCKNLSNLGLGLTGEAGECADIIKKHLHHKHDLDVDHLKKELGDVLWYVALGCDLLGTTMSEIMQSNVDKLKVRYPKGFSTEDSINRVDVG